MIFARVLTIKLFLFYFEKLLYNQNTFIIFVLSIKKINNNKNTNKKKEKNYCRIQIKVLHLHYQTTIKNMSKIDVHFRKFKNDYAEQVTAVFPYEIQSHTSVLCYSHVGQHSDCNYDYISMSKPASEAEYLPLKKELESIGYELNVISKRSHKKYLDAYWNKRGRVNIKK